MDLTTLKVQTAALVAEAFRRGTTPNHVHQKSCFIRFCNNYSLKFINPAPSTLCYFITHLSSTFSSSKSVRNYVSRVCFLHTQLRLTMEAFDSFQVSSLLRAADLTTKTTPLLGICPSFPTSSHSSASFLTAW